MAPPFEILYEDNHLIAVNKLSGILTQPSGTDQESAESLMKQWIKMRDQKPGNVFLEAVHRLDKPVSGIVLFAKTQKALSRVTQAIKQKKIEKTYLALTEKAPKNSQGTLKHFLIHDHHIAKITEQPIPGAKKAILSYRILQKDKYILWIIHLETGRYHQIRSQLAYLGCPILGDKKYGSTIALSHGRIALHHAHLKFIHPVQKRTIEIVAPFDLVKKDLLKIKWSKFIKEA